MTGNVSSLSDNIAKANLKMVFFFLTIICLFIAGSVFSTIIINAGRRHHIRSIYTVNILIEGAALILLRSNERWLYPATPGMIPIFSLSFWMGLPAWDEYGKLCDYFSGGGRFCYRASLTPPNGREIFLANPSRIINGIFFADP